MKQDIESGRDRLLARDPHSQEVSRRALRGGAAVMGAEILSALLRVASTAFLARLLLPDDFGLLSMVTAITVFAERFKDLGLSDATVQSPNLTHPQVSGLFWVNLLVCCALAAVLALLSPLIAAFYGEPRLVAVTLAVSSTFVFSGLVIQHEAVLRRRLRFGTLAAVQLSSVILSLLVSLALAVLGLGYWALVARELSRAVFLFIGTWLLSPWRPSAPRAKAGILPLLSFGRNVTGYNLAYFLSRSVDKILLGRLSGPYWVGLYDNANKLLEMPVSQVRFPVNTVALPAMSALQSDPQKFRDYYEKSSRLVTFFSIPIVVFSFVFADMIVATLLGPQWSQAVPMFRIFALGALAAPLAQMVDPSLVASGKTGRYMRLGVVNSALRVAAVVVGSLWAGAIGAAVGSSAATLLAVAVSLLFGLPHTPIAGFKVLPKLVLDLLVGLGWGLLLAALRLAVGWWREPAWLLAFAPAGVLLYLGIWCLLPEGRRRLQLYRGYLFRVFQR